MDDVKQKYGAAIAMMSPQTLEAFYFDSLRSTLPDRADLCDLIHTVYAALCGDAEAANKLAAAR